MFRLSSKIVRIFVVLLVSCLIGLFFLDDREASSHLKHQFNKVNKLTYPPAANGYISDFLHVVVIETDMNLMKKEFSTVSEYVKAEIDFSSTKNSAMLIMSDIPYSWKISNDTDRVFGQLGFEGAAPFDVDKGYKGILGGFRISSFGMRGAATPSDYERFSCYRHRVKLCQSLRHWQKHYSLSDFQIRVWKVVNPKTLLPVSDDMNITASDYYSIGYIDEICRPGVIREQTKRQC